MFSNQPTYKYLLLATDILLIVISLAFAFYWGGKAVPTADKQKVLFFAYYTSTAAFSFLVCIFALLYNDLYKRNIILTRHRQTILIIKAMLFSCAVVLLMTVVFQHGNLATFGRKFLALYFILATMMILSYRVLLVTPAMRTVAKKKFAPRRLLIIGAGGAGCHVAASLSLDPLSNFAIVGFLDDSHATGEEIKIKSGASVAFHNLGKLDQLAEVIRDQKIDEILIAIDNIDYASLIKLTDRCLVTGKVLRIYSDFLKVVAEKMRIEFYADIPVIMLSQTPAEGFAWKLKRAFDLVFATLGLLFLSPILLLIAIGIKLSSEGPVIFAQDRIGKGGRPFKFYKFRSMHAGGSSSRHQQFVKDFIKEGQDQCKSDIRVFKMTNDRRIFPFGAFIRKTSLDEFPQLYNVLKGDMSLVGPRPCLQYEWDCYDEWHKNRLNVLPGCSGLWQALGRSTVSFQEMVILDLYYISNVSLWLDIKIIVLTFPVIFLGKGAY
ncbi:MAG: sugar transferase [Bacteroidales bacterium]|jgi:exopolysaccharide biosynthesis polyprenyl glycosylphosphotransferase|nr:sugar transferase [Bacteroidales bacterium]